jgi:3-deoxy-D-manno-octulosonic-acid transferase
MLILAYSLALTLALLLASPWWLLRMLSTGRYREGLAQRLGRVPTALREAAAGKRVLWLHAVSVGEVLAATRLVADLESALEAASGPGYLIAISSTTRTGHALARQRFGADRVFYLPLDFAFATRAYLNALQPAALILMDSELWPRLLHECATRRIPILVANARISDRTFARTQRIAKLWQLMARHVTLFLTQSEQDTQRLLTLGVTPTQLQTTGNLKYDILAPKQSRVAELIKEAAAGRPIVVAGSTVGTTSEAGPHEEGWLDAIWPVVPKQANGVLLVIAPRHPERFHIAEDVVSDFGTVKATELLTGGKGTRLSFTRGEDDDRPEVVILDTIGDLAAVYGVATVALVGGSLLKRGGHNPLEPAQFGVPVIMGPSYENFRDIVDKMFAEQAILILEGEAQLDKELKTAEGLYRSEIYAMRDSLQERLIDMLANPAAARALGERGRQVFLSQQGATARATTAILKLVRP